MIYWYVCTYIFNTNGDNKILNEYNSVFTLRDYGDGKGLQITDWKVPSMEHHLLL